MSIKRILRNERGDLTFFSIFVVLAINMIIAFVMLYASVEINCMNIRNGAKMSLNNLSASIYSDTFRSQRESNLGEYWNTLYSSRSYTRQLEQMVQGNLAEKIELSNNNYNVKNIHLTFQQEPDRIQYVFSCDVVAGTLTEAQKALVVANMKIVDWHIYKNFTANPTIAGFAQEDLRQTGYLALCIAALHYNGTVEFETFAQVVVRNCLAEYCSKILPEGRHLSLDVQLETEKDTYCPYDALSAADSQNAFLTFELQELISRSKEKYSGIIRKGIEAMELRMQGFTGPEIAEMYGCKANEVTAWIARARQRLRVDRHFIAAVS